MADGRELGGKTINHCRYKRAFHRQGTTAPDKLKGPIQVQNKIGFKVSLPRKQHLNPQVPRQKYGNINTRRDMRSSTFDMCLLKPLWPRKTLGSLEL